MRSWGRSMHGVMISGDHCLARAVACPARELVNREELRQKHRPEPAEI